MQELFNKRNRVILLELVKTDFKLRYQGSFLGILWSVLKPLLLFLVMYLVFVKFLKFTDGTKTYPIVLLLGIALWGFFTEATSVGMNAIVSRGDLLRKINFPKYIIIISSMSSALISLSINLIVVLIFGLISGVDFTWRALLAPLSIIQLFILALGVSLILSTLSGMWFYRYVSTASRSSIHLVWCQIFTQGLRKSWCLTLLRKVFKMSDTAWLLHRQHQPPGVQ